MSSTELKFKKKQYNQETDSGEGVIVFDNSTNKIYVGGICYSSDVKNAALDQNDVLTIVKTETTIRVNLGAFEQSSNKVTSISPSSTDVQYPSAKCVFDSVPLKPVVVWEAETVSNGILAADVDVAQTGNTWQLTNLDMSDFERVEVYIRAGGDTNTNYTSSVVIEIDLDNMNKSPLGHFIGSAITQNPNDRNRLLAVSVVISEDKTSVLFNRCTPLYDGTAGTDYNNKGRVMYKILGYYN